MIIPKIKEYLVLKCVDTLWFNSVVYILIILSGFCAIFHNEFQHIIPQYFDEIVNTLFTIEIVLRILAERKHWYCFFYKFSNWIDIIIVAGGWWLLSIVSSNIFVLGRTARLIRMIRLMRFMRIYTKMESINRIIESFGKSLFTMMAALILLLFQIVIFSVIGRELFGESIHFANIYESSFSLFKVLTLSDWITILNDAKSNSIVCEKLVKVYFILFIITGTMIILNLFVGVIVQSIIQRTNMIDSSLTTRRSDDLMKYVLKHQKSDINPEIQRKYLIRSFNDFPLKKYFKNNKKLGQEELFIEQIYLSVEDDWEERIRKVVKKIKMEKNKIEMPEIFIGWTDKMIQRVKFKVLKSLICFSELSNSIYSGPYQTKVEYERTIKSCFMVSENQELDSKSQNIQNQRFKKTMSISKAEYELLKHNAGINSEPIIKTRYILLDNERKGKIYIDRFFEPRNLYNIAMLEHDISKHEDEKTPPKNLKKYLIKIDINAETIIPPKLTRLPHEIAIKNIFQNNSLTSLENPVVRFGKQFIKKIENMNIQELLMKNHKSLQ